MNHSLLITAVTSSGEAIWLARRVAATAPCGPGQPTKSEG